jgi:uncharacterized damage-inducible protein DinB
MSAITTAQPNTADLVAANWEQANRKLADLAEAIPSEKFETAPVQGLRACSAVLRHVGFWNRYVAETLAGKPADDQSNEFAQSAYPDKQSILSEILRTSDEVAAILRQRGAALSAAHAGMMIAFTGHTSEHYGQLAVYARLLGIVPPASRG